MNKSNNKHSSVTLRDRNSFKEMSKIPNPSMNVCDTYSNRAKLLIKFNDPKTIH